MSKLTEKIITIQKELSDYDYTKLEGAMIYIFKEKTIMSRERKNGITIIRLGTLRGRRIKKFYKHIKQYYSSGKVTISNDD